MINLRLHTEFHFDYEKGYGRLQQVVDCIKGLGQMAGAITDATTFGHIGWHNACNNSGIRPILGADLRLPISNGGDSRVTVLARNDSGLQEIYGLTSAGISGTLDLEMFLKASPDVIRFTGTLPNMTKAQKKLLKGAYADVSPSMPPDLLELKFKSGLDLVATSENRYPTQADRKAFSLFGGSIEQHPQHILSGREARTYIPSLPERAYAISEQIAAACSVGLPKAVNMTVKGNLEKICRAGIKDRLGRWTKRYEARLTHELALIREKNFESYFLIISDMVRYAKTKMIVGPARGSAAGSLVCYLAYITDVDPIAHGLLFERFIDVTRTDLPDIDLDFPDTKRELVITYLQEKYGPDNVVHVGTVLTFQPRSIIQHVGRRFGIAPFEFKPLLDVMIERSSGDSRGEFCLMDTLEGVEAGRAVMVKFPQVRTATELEGHARTTGTHAAGIVVCAEPVKRFCTVNALTATAQIDKIDAEKINLLKIDILGLRTLSVLEDVLESLPKRIDLVKIPLDDKAAFKVLNDRRWAGIFQFEGDALQMLQKMITLEHFSDIVAIGALGRPGPLNSGGAQEWCDRRMGRASRMDLHPMCSEFTEETFGIIVYQEQVMSIARKVGLLSWEDVTEIRKTMAKSKGEEFFNQYWEKFLQGALKQGIKKDAAHHVWAHLSTMGAWAFNKSHAVSYGLISYWCAYLKAHHPLKFAAATLRHTKGEEQTINVLRELTDEGIRFTPFDQELSNLNWEVINGKLVGGFINLKGIGETTGAELVATRGEWTDKQREKVESAEVLYANIYPTHDKFAGLYAKPKACGFPNVDHIWTLRELDNAKVDPSIHLPESFFFIGRLADKVPRDLNEYVFQVKRIQEGKSKDHKGQSKYLNVVMEDDTGKIYATIPSYIYSDDEFGGDITNNGIVGKSWYLMRGKYNRIKRINVTWAKDITDKEFK